MPNKLSQIFRLSRRGSRKDAPIASGLTRKEKQTVLRVIKRQEPIIRRDIQDWRTARIEATRADEPKQHLLQVLYDEVMLDALMTSQIGMRINKSQAAVWSLKNDDKTNEEATKLLQDLAIPETLFRFIIEANFFSCSLVQFEFDRNGRPVPRLVPRANVSPASGMFYPDVYGFEGEAYRERPDFGKWILEFCPDQLDLGLLNKATPYVLMKKFALSCWSELCEIYGIPPRVLKTNTQDTDMLNRAEAMMREIGAASYFIIDTEEEFEFAQANSTNGDVYKNFIATCDEQISLLNLGAVLGQDTLNGNRSKEEASANLMEIIVEADKRDIQNTFNSQVLPALASLGIIPAGLRFEFTKATDTEKLWKMVHEASSFYDFDIEWLKQTFNMEITGPRTSHFEKGGRGDSDLAAALKAGNFNFFD